MLIDATGWSWEYIDEEMTVPRMEAMFKQWGKTPPLSVSLANIASALGVNIKTEKKEQDMSSLMELFGAEGLKQERPDWLTKT